MKRYILMLWLVPAVLQAQELADPTRPFGYDTEPEIIVQEPKETQDIQWQLNGIRIADGWRSAILNGQIVQQGDTVDGARVQVIEPAWIIIEYDKQRIRLDLLDLNIKQSDGKFAQNKDAEIK